MSRRQRRAKALAKRITRKQARSYKSTVPNPMGVTAIAAVNAGGSYASRYAATRALLDKPAKKPKRKRRSKEGVAMRRRKVTRKRSRSGAVRRRRTRRAAPNRPRAAAPAKAKRRSASKKKSTSRLYGGRYRALNARLGGRKIRTYMYRTRKGKTRHIPEWGVLGYPSAKRMIKLSSTDKGARAYVKRKERLDARRSRAAERTSARILAGRYPLTPNRRKRRRKARTITFTQWEKQMRANARKPKRKKARRRRRVSARRITISMSRNKRRGRKPARRRRGRVVARFVMSRNKRRRRRARRNPLITQAAANRRRKRRRVRRRYSANLAPNRRKRRRVRRRYSANLAPNRRRKRRRVRRRYSANLAPNRRKRRRKARRNGFVANRRRYRRNQAMAFMQNFMEVLKVGGVVAVGFVAQKALSKALLSTGLLNAIPAQYQGVASNLLVALIGVPVVAKFVPGKAKLIGAGMGAAVVHTIAKAAAEQFYPGALDYLGDYTEAGSSAARYGVGSYYEYSPHQVFSGMGEYYAMPGGGRGTAGFGGLHQEAAGFGQLRADQLTQAAAGFSGSAMLTQAAAGVGEYIVAGGKGIGEYEEVTPQYSMPTRTDEGISPDLTSAEHALTAAEAAAGVGAYGDQTVPLQSMVEPYGYPEAIPDMPGGSRAGTLAGDNGIFGGAS